MDGFMYLSLGDTSWCVGRCSCTNLLGIYLLEVKALYQYQCPRVILIRLQYSFNMIEAVKRPD